MRGIFVVVMVMAAAAAGAACSSESGRGADAPSIETGAASARSGEIPLRVVVRGADGRPVAGAPVAWRVTAGGGSISPRSAVTDSAGRSAARWTLVADTVPNRAEAAARVGELWEITTFSIPAQTADSTAPAGATE